MDSADVDFAAERNNRNGDEREKHGDKRRKKIEDLVDMRWQHVLFGEQLDDVRQRLKQSMRADPSWPDAQLDMRNNLALDPLQVSEGGHQHERDDGRFDEGKNQKVHRACATAYLSIEFMRPLIIFPVSEASWLNLAC